jgi:uncharacterized RDD family membrane protein YckC
VQSIEIATAQNVTIEYQLAELRERFFALLIDTLIMLFLWIALAFLLLNLFALRSEFLAQVFSTFPLWFTALYALSCEAFLDGQTFGKRSQNIKVVRIDGKPISFGDLVLRAVLLLIDYLLTLGALGALLISTTDRRQRLGDMAAGTTVIRIRKQRQNELQDILSINTLENYTPQYPQVKQLSEQDMLFIKNAILRYAQYPNAAHQEAIETLFQHVKKVLDIRLERQTAETKIDFFKILIRDYIVLTR